MASMSKMTSAANVLAIKHFDSLYSKVLGTKWPSARLGLLSSKKHCLIANSYLLPHEQVRDEYTSAGAIDLSSYYTKHLNLYNAKISQIEEKSSPQTVKITKQDKLEDLSDGMNSADDLIQMFSDRRIDDDEKYFINRASTHLSMNDYVPASELITAEEVANDTLYYSGYDPDFQLDIEFMHEPPLEFNDQLKIYTFPRNSWSRFEDPKKVPESNLMTHFMMDGASILPVLALNLKKDDVCADFCAAPGGKSLAMILTMRPARLLCNDSSTSRLGRMYNILRQYLPDVSYIRNSLQLTSKDARMISLTNAYDKILVDVPCSNDRVSVDNMENNLFKRARTEERLRLPSVQSDILMAALRSVRPKGSVVYSTCTMSPLENDSVIQKSLMQLQMDDNNAKFAIVSLKEAFRPLRGLFKFETNLKYGQLVVPNITSNFGPMYICKIHRIS